MGAWGTSLYSNDTTSDARDTYMKFLEERLFSNEEAYTKTLEQFHDILNCGDDEEPLFWYALADTQWKVGRLTPEVKSKALEWIDKSGGIELWEERKTGETGWKKTLEKLRIRLETEQRKEKVFRKRFIPFQNPWNMNDVYAYRIHHPDCKKDTDIYGKYLLFQKIGEAESEFQKNIIMRIHVFDRIFDDIPSVDETKETIMNYRILPLSSPTQQIDRYAKRLKYIDDPFLSNQTLCMYTPVNMSSKMTHYYQSPYYYPEDELTYICTMESPINLQHEREDMNIIGKPSGDSSSYWQYFNSRISFYFRAWQGVEYEIIGDGTFEYPTLEQQEQIRAKINKDKNLD